MHVTRILKDIRNIVDQSHSFLITGQANPDGDSVGSQLALYDMLRQYMQQIERPLSNEQIIIVNNELPPAHYWFFPHIDLIRPFEIVEGRTFDTGFVLDAASDRVGRVAPMLAQCRSTINIDHHHTRGAGQENVTWVDPQCCSVSEMMFAFLEDPDWKLTLNANIAACLYAGIIYDTGSFRYPKTTARTHRIAARCVETGIDFSKIAEHLFLEQSFARLQLQGAVLQGLQRDFSGAIIWGSVTQKMMKAAQTQPDDTEGLITLYAFTEGTKAAVLLKEVPPDSIKVSLRSRGAVDVGAFAQKIHPHGGGHPRAAGFTMEGSLHEVEEIVITALQQELGGIKG